MSPNPMSEHSVNQNDDPRLTPAKALRGGLGGVLMGLANLVPGLSGGTMLLAAGVYPQFIRGIAEVSTFRLRLRTILFLGCVVGSMLIAIVALAVPVKNLVVEQRWAMYSLFIGLTLGGVPLIFRMVRPLDPKVIIAAIAGILAMAALVVVQSNNAGASAESTGAARIALLVFAGIAAGSAMILPGVSGAYLLLILGQYVTILAAVGDARSAVGDLDWGALSQPLAVIIPLGIGVVVGVVGVSNLIKVLLDRFPRPTLGVLLGLLLGAVIGLWPFEHPVEPEIGATIKGQVVTTENLADFEPEDWETGSFDPGAGHIAGAIGLILVGFAASIGVARIGGNSGEKRPK